MPWQSHNPFFLQCHSGVTIPPSCRPLTGSQTLLPADTQQGHNPSFLQFHNRVTIPPSCRPTTGTQSLLPAVPQLGHNPSFLQSHNRVTNLPFCSTTTGSQTNLSHSHGADQLVHRLRHVHVELQPASVTLGVQDLGKRERFVQIFFFFFWGEAFRLTAFLFKGLKQKSTYW